MRQNARLPRGIRRFGAARAIRKLNPSTIRAGLPVALLVALAMACRRVRSEHATVLAFAGLLRSLIYLGLFSAWGVSLGKRIIARHTRRYLTAIAGLLVGWVLIRTLKYFFLVDADALRRCWYAYYLAMLFVPTLSLQAALCLGKGEAYAPPKRTKALTAVAALLALLVLTNDLHQLVFTFPPGAPRTDRDYGYGAAYWAVTAWEVGMAASALAMMLHKCRLPRSGRVLWLPFVPLGILVCYALLYILRVPFLFAWFGDLTVFECCFVVAIWESCLQTGLIQTNTGYGRLLALSTVPLFIADNALNVVYSSFAAENPRKEALAAAVDAPVLLEGGIRLCSAPVPNGRIFWQEDLSALARAAEELAETQAELREYGDVLKAEYEQKTHRLKLREQNRLYDEMLRQTAPQVELLSGLLEKLAQATEPDEGRRIMSRIVVVGAYLKRRYNLIFLSRKSATVPPDELALCLKESASALETASVACDLRVTVASPIPVEAAALAYDFFESAVEGALDALTCVLALFEANGRGFRVAVNLQCGPNAPRIKEKFPESEVCRDEDGVWYLTLLLTEGGVPLCAR